MAKIAKKSVEFYFFNLGVKEEIKGSVFLQIFFLKITDHIVLNINLPGL